MIHDIRGAVYFPTFKAPDRNRWPIPFPTLGKLYKIVDFGVPWSESDGKIIFPIKMVEDESGIWIEYLEGEKRKFIRWVLPPHSSQQPNCKQFKFLFGLIPVKVDEPGDGG